MKSSDLLRLVDQMHHDKNIKRDIIFDGIEAALQLAAQKHFGEEAAVVVSIDRNSGDISVIRNGEQIDPALLGRIPAQSAKNVMIQKIREAESNAVFNEFTAKKGDLIMGLVGRHEAGAAVASIGKTEALLPRSEQIPGETYHVGDRVKAVISEVKKAGQKVKIILSRTHPEFVRRLFEEEIPEIQERIIEIKAIAREAGYRTKIAVSSIDLKVDCVGACVGVRGSRIKNIVDELGGERIDIVRWNDSLQVMIPNALQPAQIEEVFLYPRPGRAIVLVQEDQLSLAIGRRGQNVRLASKLVGWDIEIMTHEELNDSIEKAVTWFMVIPNITEEMVERFIEEGFMSFDDLSLCDAAELMDIADLTEQQAEEIVDFAEDAAARLERGQEIPGLEAGEVEIETAAGETEEETGPELAETQSEVQPEPLEDFNGAASVPAEALDSNEPDREIGVEEGEQTASAGAMSTFAPDEDRVEPAEDYTDSAAEEAQPAHSEIGAASELAEAAATENTPAESRPAESPEERGD